MPRLVLLLSKGYVDKLFSGLLYYFCDKYIRIGLCAIYMMFLNHLNTGCFIYALTNSQPKKSILHNHKLRYTTLRVENIVWYESLRPQLQL